ncbi:MAG: DNA integrity scanning diadenylate cyclase DisA [Clostridium argentinense]|uniref:DNA integrity scanning protein DisA n=1 Tax=Clostridium faecium TaxID=2762223 RepID=A0ABR8YUJ5_9CLOT|nr:MULTISPECIES: DNA integrity scanning diadenylate cyclase DisA [Clostridium]MBD8047663.1 DNA integrity scanning protein DisA [Clostridium faecium]MBS5824531.1 DNA integrity scanning diadenylate cyclase DisA [Clostridium argentinense]MDU1350780.1 DNA integrity scanning diadenylate cyclase DisA [Clostridium argentinense]
MKEERQNEFINILKILSPGTLLREGLDNILYAKTGALIVLSDSDEVLSLIDGGFNIYSEYTPAYIYELAKMDGAIIVSSDLKKILYANTQLIPDASISTLETGTRHRTAQRVAKQTGSIVIAISQRKNLITVYKDDIKYIVRDSREVLANANQALNALEKYVLVFQKIINNLTRLELHDSVTLVDVVTAIQRVEMIMRIVDEIEIYIFELGIEGRLIEMQLKELIKNIEEDGIDLIRDYAKEETNTKTIYRNIQKLSKNELLDLNNISKLLGYNSNSLADTLVFTKGYRVLNKIAKIPNSVIENLINHFKQLRFIERASFKELDEVEGIGTVRAKTIKNGIEKLKEQYLFHNEI